ncbi:Uracil-DNA glycosylase [Paramicrosporidium saccamoebae]|uniref:Uracil-DNA glycosylase n=1 Tax=Paramicrosporidium saccamoebae TaxID=1246581 RepID=A0A2H9TNV1_9FUNG|nr:Uracil-DNA glycosylase [Paramicrosporidium saccamoebae]
MTTANHDGKRPTEQNDKMGSAKKGKVQSSILAHFSKVQKQTGADIISSPIPIQTFDSTKESTSSGNSGGVNDRVNGGVNSTDLDSETLNFTPQSVTLDSTPPLKDTLNSDTSVVSINLTPEEQEFLALEIEQLPAEWIKILHQELTKPYFRRLKEFLLEEQRRHTVFPPSPLIYSWTQCAFSTLKVVIIGQDPYHNFKQAMGLCFSVPRGTAIPPSLLNIYKELAKDVSFVPPAHGDLTSWSQRGVLLLNTALTVRAHEPASHSGRGWEQFTDAVIRAISKERMNVVFILWGNHAQKKASMIDRKRHLVLTGVHPSPLSASRGFFGCQHFSKANEYLQSHGRKPIDWQLPQ